MRYIRFIGIAAVGTLLAAALAGAQTPSPQFEPVPTETTPGFVEPEPEPPFMAVPERTRPCGAIRAGRIRALATSCARAKRVIRYAVSHPNFANNPSAPPGWLCLLSKRSPAVTKLIMSCSRRDDPARARLYRF